MATKHQENTLALENVNTQPPHPVYIMYSHSHCTRISYLYKILICLTSRSEMREARLDIASSALRTHAIAICCLNLYMYLFAKRTQTYRAIHAAPIMHSVQTIN